MLALMVLLAACGPRMTDRPPRRPLGASPFFSDRSASRPPVPDTVPRVAAAAPAAVSVERGREQYEIFCAPCHGLRGDGDGVIVAHGFPRPPAFSSETPAEIVEIITNGRKAMYSYADRVPERDRWAIAAYVQRLQALRVASYALRAPSTRNPQLATRNRGAQR
jgi:mono/diheme cytochrome c family protein